MFSRQGANDLINSLKICDPAVGSGHFLVSALNEMIAIKNDLNILQDRTGRRLKEYQVEVVNDELIVTDEDGELFEYNPTGKESQRIQEALFHEKQQIIENCLFGVDINPNSVKICRLRLWIELLKNAYYKNETELETLPNIDINIKCGNSLISRFDLDADLSKSLKDSKWNIDSYRLAVDTYRNAQNKEQKREMERIIHDIKNDFRSEISSNDPKVKRLQKTKGELFLLTNQTQMFEMSKREKATWNKKLEKLSKDSKKFEAEIREIKDNKIYENAFEWRFEFPEVLDDNGEYVGFDVVIGNPPYIKERDAKETFMPLRQSSQWQVFIEGKMDLWYFFLHLGFNICHPKSIISFITNSYWMKSDGSKKLIKRISQEKTLDEIIYFDDYPIFEEVSGKHMIHSYRNEHIKENRTKVIIIDKTDFKKNIYLEEKKTLDFNALFTQGSINIEEPIGSFFRNCESLGDLYNTTIGVQESPDKLASKNIPEDFRDGYKAGDGVFVINNKELEDLQLTNAEMEVIKPYLNTSHVNRYGKDFREEYLIFSDKETRGKIASGIYPNIKRHLDKYLKFITSSNAPYGLHRDRSSKHNPFEQAKLLCKGMFASPEFTFDNDNYYVGFSFTVITEKNKQYSLQFLLSLLNSKLGTFWFLTNGKKRGIGVDIGVKKFRLFPVRTISKIEQQPFIDIVNKLLEIKKENPTADTSSLEAEIDQLVYGLYGLTEEEIGIVEAY
jgi:hypothetical protein